MKWDKPYFLNFCIRDVSFTQDLLPTAAVLGEKQIPNQDCLAPILKKPKPHDVIKWVSRTRQTQALVSSGRVPYTISPLISGFHVHAKHRRPPDVHRLEWAWKSNVG